MFEAWKRKRAINAVKRERADAQFRESNGETIPQREWRDYEERLRKLDAS